MITSKAGFALVALAIGATVAHGHEAPSGWIYPHSCCHDQDCAPIDAKRVKELPHGYLIDGTHFVREADVRDSPDGIFHACFPTKDKPPICFWRPSNSY